MSLVSRLEGDDQIGISSLETRNIEVKFLNKIILSHAVFLDISAIFEDLVDSERFVAAYLAAYRRIKKNGIILKVYLFNYQYLWKNSK